MLSLNASAELAPHGEWEPSAAPAPDVEGPPLAWAEGGSSSSRSHTSESAPEVAGDIEDFSRETGWELTFSSGRPCSPNPWLSSSAVYVCHLPLACCIQLLVHHEMCL